MKEELYISAPGKILGEKACTNQEIIDRVKAKYQGAAEDWRKIETGIRVVFRYCGSETRHLGMAKGKTLADYAVEASKDCLEKASVTAENIDLLIYGGIAREYYEPSTAMEVAAKLGIKRIHAFDTTSACVGLLQSLYNAAALMHLDDSIQTALCCSADLTQMEQDGGYLDYSINSFDDLSTKVAGLTIGNAATAWLIQRKPFKSGGSGRLLGFQNTSLPETFDICKLPINGKFTSHNKQVFDLGLEHVPLEINKLVQKIDWTMDEVNHFISHQPSKKIIEQLCKILNIPIEKAPITHHLYGNTAASAVPLTMDFLLEKNGLNSGDKVILSSAAAGFTMVSVALQWYNQ